MNIILKDIKLFGYHGVHPLENSCGTDFINEIEISILKSNPPIENFIGKVGVQLKKRTNEM